MPKSRIFGHFEQFLAPLTHSKAPYTSKEVHPRAHKYPEILVISIQEEINQENGISQPQQQQQLSPQQQQFAPQQQQQFASQQQQQFAPQQQQFSPQQQQQFAPQQQQQFASQQQQRFATQQQQQQPRQLSRADVRALQQQESALDDIIALQNSLNFPGQQ